MLICVPVVQLREVTRAEYLCWRRQVDAAIRYHRIHCPQTSKPRSRVLTAQEQALLAEWRAAADDESACREPYVLPELSVTS